jgi:glycosyltransferase involved in cell wall biosynthesis
MGISLCMIVKNEEDWVVGAVESVRSIVNEVIIVDTGSTDSTLDRIASIGAKILKLKWKDSFASARNISLAEATEPWILVLDGDERVARRDLPYIKDAAEGGDADGYHLIQRNYVTGKQVIGWTANVTDYEEGVRYNGYVDNPLIRLFRNAPDIRFHGSVHEIIDPTRLPSKFRFSSSTAVIHHYGKVRGEERVSAKQRLYLALGLKRIGEEPQNAKAYFDLGIQYQELARHEEACACFDQTFEMTRMPIALLYWALSEKQLRHYENAEDLLHRALQLGLDTLHVHLELGNVHLAQGEFNPALSDYARCLAINPNNPIVLYNYGLVLRKSGDAGGATQSYERALQIDPHFREPIIELAVLYLHSGRPDDALAILKNLPAMDGVALSLVGAAQLQKDDVDEAQKSLEAALRKDRTLTDARMNLAQIYTRRGDHARAARYLQSVAVR